MWWYMVGIGKSVELSRNWKGGFCRIQGKKECGMWRKMSKFVLFKVDIDNGVEVW